MNRITPQNLPASCCNFTGSNVLHIKIFAKFDVDLFVTILNYQFNLALKWPSECNYSWNCMYHVITLQGCSRHKRFSQV